MKNNLIDYFDNLYKQQKLSQSFLIGNTTYDSIKDDLKIIVNKYIFNYTSDIEENPDVYLYTTEEGIISKDDIRTLLKNITTTSQFNNNKVYIIDECEKLNDFAYNAILKTLEEPQKGIYAFLITKNIDSVKSTISSRCQKIFISSEFIDNEFEQQYIDIGNLLFENIEKNNLKTIGLIPEIYNKVEDRHFLLNVLKYMQSKYNSLLKNKVNSERDKYDIIKISKKIIILEENINRISNYVNKNLSIDRLIIEMWRCNNENSWDRI